MSTLIKEIHNSFSAAEEQLIKEANNIINQNTKTDLKEKADGLASLGFTNSKPVKNLTPAELKKAKDLKRYVDKYSIRFPQNRFITKSKVTELCEKYGLVFGSAKLYSGDIPQDKIDEILAFSEAFKASEIADEIELYKHFEWFDTESSRAVRITHLRTEVLEELFKGLKNSRATTAYKEDLENSKDFVEFCPHTTAFRYLKVAKMCIERELEERGIGNRRSLAYYKEGQVRNVVSVDMEMVADIGSFTMSEDHFIDEKTYEIKTDIGEISLPEPEDLFQDYDPIALQPVPGGYLIAAAWGDEASDEDVIAPGRN